MSRWVLRIATTFAVLIAVCGVSPAQDDGGGSGTLFKAMQSTGKPALIIAGSKSCVYCRQMATELQNESSLQPYVRQMFVIKVDTATADWPVLKKTFNFDERGIPAVFFVRADGKLIYGAAGKPSDLEGFLKEQLDQSGKLLDEKSLEQLGKAAKAADQALKRKNYPQAINLINQNAGSGSYAAVSLAFDQLGEQLTQQAKKQAGLMVNRLEKPGAAAVAAAIDLKALETAVAEYEPARKVVDEALAKAAEDEDQKQLLENVEQLAPAREAETGKKWKEAVAGYESVAASNAEGPLHDYALNKARQLKLRVK
jgi:thioredoxin-related protein